MLKSVLHVKNKVTTFVECSQLIDLAVSRDMGSDREVISTEPHLARFVSVGKVFDAGSGARAEIIGRRIQELSELFNLRAKA